jgi:hypothetical protein
VKPTNVIGVLGSIIGLAALAILVARPQIVGDFFSGSSQLLGTAISPVTNPQTRKPR